MTALIRSRRFVLILTSLLALSLAHATHATSLEPNVVYLEARSGEKIVYTDYFFEILDLGDHVLIPVTALPQEVGLASDFRREESIFTISHRESGQEVLVDLSQLAYIDRPEWSHEPPVVHDAELYVTPLLVEHLSGVEFEWSSRLQQLTVTTDWPVEEREPERGPDRVEKTREAPEPTVYGPSVSLGSIQYRTTVEYRYRPPAVRYLTLRQLLNVHGRVGDWALSVGMDALYRPATKEGSISLPLIRATYREHDTLIVLGDSRVAFPGTTGTRSIRGLLYQYPQVHTSRLFSYTSVSGTAGPGDKVELFVNGLPFGETGAGEDGSYSFTRVPLRVNRLNTLRVVVTDAVTEEKTETTQRMVGHPRVLEEVTSETLVALGLYQDPGGTFWPGALAGLTLNRALGRNMSLWWETVLKRQSPFDDSNPIKLGSVVGTGVRLGERSVATLDWLVGGEADDLGHGASLSLLYGLSSGYGELLYSHVPPEVEKGVREVVGGQRTRVTGTLDLSAWWSLSAQAESRRSFPQMPLSQSDSAQITVSYRDRWRTLTSLTGRYSERLFQRLTADLTTEDVQITERKAILERRSQGIGFSRKGTLSLSMADVTVAERAPYTAETAAFTGNFSQRITGALFTGGNLDLTAWWIERDFLEADLETDGYIRWSMGSSTFLTTRAGVRGDISNRLEFEEEQLKIDLSLRHYLSRYTSLHASGGWTYMSHIDDSFVTYSVGGSHLWHNGDGRVSLDLGYVSPVFDRMDPQYRGVFDLRLHVGDNVELGFQARRDYDSLYSATPEHAVMVGIGHALGFARGTVQGQTPPRARDHEPFIGGLVYLDLNRNGVFDEGEPVIQGITMSLDGRRAQTNDKGVFMFEHVRPGIYVVSFDPRSLPADYSVTTGPEVVKIRENENIFLHFGLTMEGSVSGRVFLDRDADGVMGADDEPLQWVGVRFEETGKTAFTRKDGTFYVGSLPLGEHTVTILKDSLPRGTRPVDDGRYVVRLTQHELDVRGLLAPVVYASESD